MSDGRTVVIGAGPAGLASAAELRRKGVPVVVLERADAIGASWRGRYDRLRLNSSRWFSKLPGGRYARGTAVFPSRDEVVGYLEAYAQRNAVKVRLNTEVQRIDPGSTGWIVRTSGGDVVAEQVIVAAGYEHTPFVPDWPGRERFHGPLLHAAEYRNPEPFRDGDVLVVGPGCSGMEIAYDLAEGGARKVSLAVRTPPNLLVRSPMGPAFALALMRVRPQRADRIVNFIRSKEIGDLTEYGLPVPEEGTFSRLRRLGVAPAIIDKPVIQAIRDRRIEIVAGVQSLDDTGVGLADGTRIEPEAVIAATGYRCGLEPVVGHLDVLDDEGVPRAFGAEPAAPGLRFVGYVHLPAHLRHAGREARWAAKAVAFDLRARVGPAASGRVAAFGT
jgi:NADPH-dependent 2,4-dienoyl-CoA reductase/sulfur reductase-like enzyme